MTGECLSARRLASAAALIFSVLGLSACGTVPLIVVGMDAQEIQRISDFELCHASNTLVETRGRRFPTIEAEIARRGLTCGGAATAEAAELGNEAMMDPSGEPPAQSAGTPTTALRNVNVRAGPGTEHAVRRVLRAGEAVMVLRVLGTWCECMDGTTVVYVSCAQLAPPAGGWGALASGSAGEVPSYDHNSAYPDLRRRLLREGWNPYRPPGYVQGGGCMAGDIRCQGFSETIFCAGTGQATCWYGWRRGDQYLLIAGLGESDQQGVGGVRQCSNLVYSDDGHPWEWCRQDRPRASAVSSLSLALIQALPGWTLLQGDPRCEADARTSVSGDFNGDGVVDYAVRVARGGRAQIVALLNVAGRYQIVVLEDGSVADLRAQLLTVVRRGSRHLIIDSTDLPRRPMTLPNDAPVGGTCESSSYIYLIRGSTVARAFTSD